MKKNKSILLASFSMAMLLASCGGPKKLANVEGFTYEDGILSFNPVEGATAYEFVFSHKGEIVYQDTLEVTSLDVESLGLEGNINLSIKPVGENAYGEAVDYSFSVLSTFNEVLFEAENYLYNFGTGKSDSNFRNNPQASNGAYVGGLDDGGQGIYIDYLSPFAGEFTVESYYCWHKTTAATCAHHAVWVNNVYQTDFNYTEDTGWGGASFTPAVSTTTITLVKGWNTIGIMKDGTEADNWGDFAEIDYIKLIGNEEKYNIDDLDAYGVRPNKYRLEAEMGSPRRKFPSGLYQCKNPCIRFTNDMTFSNGYIMGNIENKYDGVEWHFDSPVKAKYKIQICYAAGQFEGCKPAMPSFVVTPKAIGLQKNIDFQDYEIKQMSALPYTGWNNPSFVEDGFEITLDAGDNFIYCLLYGDSGFFQIDYCDLTFIEEII